MTAPAAVAEEVPRLALAAWLEVIEQEYLQSFIASGGASVKFPVADTPTLRAQAWQHLDELARQDGYVVAHVRAEETRVHLAHELFFQVARQVPWAELAETVCLEILEENGYRLPASREGNIAERLYRDYLDDPTLLKQTLYPALRKEAREDRQMARDFRLAMIALCQHAAAGSGPIEEHPVYAWLTGQATRLASVKEYQVFAKITRTNATTTFESLLHWIRRAGKPGLVLMLDIARLSTPPPRPRDATVYYNKSMLLDAYEVLRQFIDATDRMEGALVVAFADAGFPDDDPRGRGIGAYQALNYRVVDEVRGKRLVNPLASLVRLSS